MKKEIETLKDIKLLVDGFYRKVREDELLKDIFNEIIKDNWDKHLEKMYTFWQTVLLDEHTYFGSPFAPHASLPIGEKHFERWLQLFKENIEEHFEGVKAEEAIWRANKMAQMFQFKIEHYKNINQKPLH